jgi:hypothetical protein
MKQFISIASLSRGVIDPPEQLDEQNNDAANDALKPRRDRFWNEREYCWSYFDPDGELTFYLEIQ